MTKGTRRSFRHIFRRAHEIRREVDEEIAFHLEMRRRQLEAEGYGAEEARREALRQFGDLEGTRAVGFDSDYRRERRMAWKEVLRECRQDVRVALRQLVRRPAFAAIAVIPLALGIGANTAIFSAADHVLLRPLPYREAQRVVTLWETDGATGERKREVSPGNFVDWRDRSQSFSAIGLAQPSGIDLVLEDGPPQPLSLWRVTEGFLPALGVQPVVGRGFLPEDFRRGEGMRALISHQLWRERFGGDPAIAGRTIQLDFKPAMVLGVLPPELEYPERADVWAPKCLGTLGIRSCRTARRRTCRWWRG